MVFSLALGNAKTDNAVILFLKRSFPTQVFL